MFEHNSEDFLVSDFTPEYNQYKWDTEGSLDCGFSKNAKVNLPMLNSVLSNFIWDEMENIWEIVEGNSISLDSSEMPKNPTVFVCKENPSNLEYEDLTFVEETKDFLGFSKQELDDFFAELEKAKIRFSKISKINSKIDNGDINFGIDLQTLSSEISKCIQSGWVEISAEIWGCNETIRIEKFRIYSSGQAYRNRCFYLVTPQLGKPDYYELLGKYQEQLDKYGNLKVITEGDIKAP